MTQNNRFRIFNAFSPLIPGRWMSVRIRLLRWCGVECDESVTVSEGTRFYGDGKIVLGKCCIIRGEVRLESIGSTAGKISLGAFSEVNHGAYLSANEGSSIFVGDHCRLAHGVLMKTATHEIDVAGKCVAGNEKHLDIVVDDGTWLCAGAIVIPGVRIGKKNVIAAGAVVTRDTPDGVLVAGVPATVKKRYLI